MNAFAMTALSGVAAAITLSGCAATNKTRPGDMTIPEHEQAAKTEAKAAEEAARAIGFGRGAAYAKYSADRHRGYADEHAAAADQRRAEVAATCDGVVMATPLSKMKTERVEAIREADVPRNYYPERLKGVRIAVVTASPAEAACSITCEAARESAGLVAESGNSSPFAIGTARTTARPADTGVVVEIRSPDEDDAAEIVRRAVAMSATAMNGQCNERP